MGGLVDAIEMDHRHHRFYHHQSHSRSSRGRDKSHRLAAGGDGAGMSRNGFVASDPMPAARDPASTSGRAHGEGNGQFRKETNILKVPSDSFCNTSSPIEENSFTLEFRQSSSKKASGKPIKALIEEEMLREKELKQPSPSVIARLMGLDTLPPPKVSHKQQKENTTMGTLDTLPPPKVSHKQQKENTTSFQKTSTVGLQGGYSSDEDRSLRTSTLGHQEFKDVFEVVESSKGEKHENQTVWKGMGCSKKDEKELHFVRQKLMEAKRISTSDLNDTLDALDSNKDLFLKFLQEPNSLFVKHLHDLKCFPPSPQPNRVTLLKSSEGTKYGSSEVCIKSERKAMQKYVTSSFRKPTTNHVSSLKETSNSYSHKLLDSQYTSNTDACLHPTRIVVLKPSLEKVQGTTRTVSLQRSASNLQFGFGRHKEFQPSRILESQEEGRPWHRFNNPEVTRHKTKGSREIAREITEHMRLSHIKDESLCFVTGMSRLDNYGSYRQTSNDFDDRNSNYYSSSYSNKSSMSMEARKRISERYKMTRRFQEVGLSGRGSSTLGEILALSDTEIPRTTFDSLVTQKPSDEKSACDEILATGGCPLGISSRDGWKDGCFINLPRSVSVPASSTVHESPKPISRHADGGSENCYMLKDVLNFGVNDSLHGNVNRRRLSRRSFKCNSEKPHYFNSGGEENKLPLPEICVNLEERRNRIHAKNLAKGKKPVLSELSDSTIANIGHLVENSLLPESMDVKLRRIFYQEQVQQPTKDIESSVSDDKSIEETTSCGHLQEDILSSRCEQTESESTVSSKEAEQPSPVSVLEPLSEEETSSSGCFKKISTDLQELRIQLQLLKLESEDTYAEEPQVLLTDEFKGGDHHSLLQLGAIEHAFEDDNERDFSYLLDILVVSGIHSVKQDRFFDACYLPECPVDPAVFEMLENKYGVVVAWSRTDRKLLFDFINSVLAEILAPCMDLHPWVKPKRRLGLGWPSELLAEEVWRIVTWQRKELRRGKAEDKVLDSRWSELGDDTDMIGREIERMLKEELLDELVSEFVSW